MGIKFYRPPPHAQIVFLMNRDNRESVTVTESIFVLSWNISQLSDVSYRYRSGFIQYFQFAFNPQETKPPGRIPSVHPTLIHL